MAKTIIVIGGNLFQIAQQYLGDATQWNRIAEATGGAIDPILPNGVQTTLVIPVVDSALGGGVYSGTRSPPPAIILHSGRWDETTWDETTWS